MNCGRMRRHWFGCTSFIPIVFHFISSHPLRPTRCLQSTNSPFPVKKDVSESREFLEKILPNEENPDIEKFALMLLPTEEESEAPRGEMVGFVGTNRYKEQGMEVGYVINRRYWGLGYATEGLRLFLDMYWGLPRTFTHLSY